MRLPRWSTIPSLKLSDPFTDSTKALDDMGKRQAAAGDDPNAKCFDIDEMCK